MMRWIDALALGASLNLEAVMKRKEILKKRIKQDVFLKK